MPIKELSSDDRIDVSRGDVVVAIPVFGGYDLLVQCLESVFEHTPEHATILIADDASIDPSIRQLFEKLETRADLTHEIVYVRHPKNLGFVKNMNAVFSMTGEADVIILNSDCIVADGWYEGLKKAAYSDSLVATASTLTNHGTILSVPHRNVPTGNLPQDFSLEAAASQIKQASQRLYPRIPTAVGHCTYIKRAALELVGDFDPIFSPGYGEEVDFSQRCVLNGLCHVVADDVFVLHYGSGSFNEAGGVNELQRSHDRIISDRYRYYDNWVEEVAADQTSQLARSLTNAKTALRPISVTIDGRVLGPHVTGTQVYLLEIVGALKRTEDVELRVVVPEELGDYARHFLVHHNIQFISIEEALDRAEDGERSDIVHRPFQITSYDDLELLTKLGNRLIISHLDLIAFHNPGYFHSFKQWNELRLLTQIALATADRVIFISRHAADDAIKGGLIERERAAIGLLGSDHALVQINTDPKRPESLPSDWPDDFLLCLGTNFRHKNREFAIKLLKELRESHDWDGTLVFAGPAVERGSSAGEESELLLFDRELSESVIDLAAVGEEEKAWLMANAAAVVYPSTHEGFGFLPFEAAEAGVPCIFAAQSSLEELLPSYLALITPWDERATAARSAGILKPGPERDRHVEALQATSAKYTWGKAGRTILNIYKEALRAPMGVPKKIREELDELLATTVYAKQLEAEKDDLLGYIEELEWRAAAFERLSDVDRGLVSSGGIPERVRRPLLAISHRGFLRKLFFAPLYLGGTITYKLSRKGRSNGTLEEPHEPPQLEATTSKSSNEEP